MSNCRWDDNEISKSISHIKQGTIKWLIFEYDNKPLKVSTLKIKQCGREPQGFINALSSRESNLGYIKGDNSDIFVQSIPDIVDNLKRVFCFIHSKKLQRVLLLIEIF